jgi:hypothetical protein
VKVPPSSPLRKNNKIKPQKTTKTKKASDKQFSNQAKMMRRQPATSSQSAVCFLYDFYLKGFKPNPSRFLN